MTERKKKNHRVTEVVLGSHSRQPVFLERENQYKWILRQSLSFLGSLQNWSRIHVVETFASGQQEDAKHERLFKQKGEIFCSKHAQTLVSTIRFSSWDFRAKKRCKKGRVDAGDMIRRDKFIFQISQQQIVTSPFQ